MNKTIQKNSGLQKTTCLSFDPTHELPTWDRNFLKENEIMKKTQTSFIYKFKRNLL